MNNIIKKLGKKINGKIEIPGDKSISIRAALIANLFDGDFEFKNFNFCDDTKAALSCMKKLAEIKLISSKSSFNKKSIKNINQTVILNCKNSATTMRLLSGMLVSLYQDENIIFKLVGDESLSKRPMNRIVIPLKKMGADITASKNGTAPLTIKCKNCSIKNINYTSKTSSAQVKSCLELAAFSAGKKLIYKEPFKSRNHTEIMLNYFTELSEHHHKGDCHCNEHHHNEHECLHKNCHCHNNIYIIPSDISAASYYIANAIIYKNSNISLNNILLNPTRTGFITSIQKMGVKISIKNKKILQGELIGDISLKNNSTHTLKAKNISEKHIPSMIDEIPLLAILLATADGISTINGISELKVKESNRLLAITQFLDIIGTKYTIKNDNLKIYGDKNIDLSKIHNNINNKKSLEPLLNSKDHRILLILKLLNIKGIKYPEFLNTSL